MTDTNTCTSATARRLCYSVLDLCCQFYRIPLGQGKHVLSTVDTLPLVEKEWSQPRMGVRNTVARRRGDFAAEDVRLRDENQNTLAGTEAALINNENLCLLVVVSSLISVKTNTMKSPKLKNLIKVMKLWKSLAIQLT